MKTILISFLFMLSLSTSGQTVSDLFKSMPTDLLPGVSEGNKTLLLVDTGQTSVPYVLGEISKIAHSDDFLYIRTSDVGDIQLKLLPLSNDSLIVCLIQTVCTDVCDSRINFFTTEWKKLDPQRYLTQFTAEIFFNSSQKNSDNYKYAVSLPDIYPISAMFSDNNSDLTLRFNYRERLTDDQIAEIQPYLKSDSVILTWKNATFR